MGTSNSVRELNAKLAKMGNAIEDANRQAVEAGALTVKTRVLAQVAPVLGGDLAFTGAGKQRPKRVGVRYNIEGGGKRAFVRATGPMHWLESGVKPHAIAPKGAGGSRAARTAFVAQAFGSGPISFGRGRRAGVLAFVDGSFRPYARRAGKFTARHTWTKGVESSKAPVAQQFRTVQGAALVRTFT